MSGYGKWFLGCQEWEKEVVRRLFVKYAKKDIGGLQINKVNNFRIYF